jgi:hypothetical protein
MNQANQSHTARAHAVPVIGSLGENHDSGPILQELHHGFDGISARQRSAAVQGDAAERGHEPARKAVREQLLLGHIVDRHRGCETQQGNVLPSLMFWKKNEGTSLGDIVLPLHMDFKKKGQDNPGRRSDDEIDKRVDCVILTPP